MSWIIGAQAVERRRRLLETRRIAGEVESQTKDHPLLGVGGRSIELSLRMHLPVDPNSFELAAQALHDCVVSDDKDRAALLDAATWLSSLPEVELMPDAAKRSVQDDLSRLRIRTA